MPNSTLQPSSKVTFPFYCHFPRRPSPAATPFTSGPLSTSLDPR